MYRRRSIKTLSESRTSQISLLPTTTAVAPTTMHSNSNQCNQGQGEQYLPGQHWLADPGPGNLVVTGHGEQICAEQGFDTSNNNYLNMGAFGGSHLSPFGPNNGQMSCSSSNTIHHTGQQQLPSTSYTPSYRQGQHSMTLASSPQYFAGRSLNYNPGNTMNAHAPPPYLPSCNSYHPHPYRHHQHQIHGPNSAAGFSTSQTCHYHVGGHIVLGSATPAPTAAVASTSTAPRIKTRKNSAASSSALLLSRIPWRSSSEMFAYGGLSVLWRQVPEACQKIVTQHDIPDTVKVRGYFTVCELLELKRSLMGRLNNMEPGKIANLFKKATLI